MPRWARPYERDQDGRYALRYAMAVAMSVAGLFPLCGIAKGDLPSSAVFVVGPFVLLWEVMLWRVALVGVYVNDHGIKVRMLHRTHVFPWSQVTRAWAGQAAAFDAWQIWISAGSPERDFETPLWRRGARASHSNRVVLAPEEFASVLAALNSPR